VKLLRVMTWNLKNNDPRQGLSLAHFSPQPEPFPSLTSPDIHHEKCSRQAEKWTSVSP
jgi:hypothetical protein